MDDRTRLMIDAYIPSPRDETLGDGEYYYRQETARGPRVIRVFALDVLPMRDGNEYGIYQRRPGGRFTRVDTRGDGDLCRGVRMCELYDNKIDCRDMTHTCFDGWESLRRAQEEVSE